MVSERMNVLSRRIILQSRICHNSGNGSTASVIREISEEKDNDFYDPQACGRRSGACQNARRCRDYGYRQKKRGEMKELAENKKR